MLQYFGFEFTPREAEMHAGIRLIPEGMVAAKTPEEYEEILLWLRKLCDQNDALGLFDRSAFSTLIETLESKTLEQMQENQENLSVA